MNDPPPKIRWELTQEIFDGLLYWLDPDREKAAVEYQKIHSRLVQGFINHNCPQSIAEFLADETINRVAKKLPDIQATYTGNPARYFFGVAHKVRLEYFRKEALLTELPSREIPDSHLSPEAILEEVGPEFRCLQRCIEGLTQRNRELILKYYQGEKGVKIELRKALAGRFGIELPLLRLQAQRIRTSLKKCILDCLAQ